MPNKKAELLLLAVVGTALITTSAMTTLRHSQNRSPGRAQQSIDLERWPIADHSAPESSDTSIRARRRARNKKYDKSEWPIHPDDVADSTVRVGGVNRDLPAFPIDKSSVVVIAVITKASSYLSNDKSGVYSEFTVCIEEVLKNDQPQRLGVGGTVDVEREGGRVRFPSGRVHWYAIAKLGMPSVGGRYVLFLTGESEEFGLTIVTGYELKGGKVAPLDDLHKLNAYKDADELAFLNELRAALINVH